MNHEDLLNRKLGKLFPDERERVSAVELLAAYGVESHEREPYRVRLAVLKLSGPDIAAIKQWIKQAKEDFRDILSWAEYPRQSKTRPMPDGPEKQKLLEADRQEYEQWLDS